MVQASPRPLPPRNCGSPRFEDREDDGPENNERIDTKEGREQVCYPPLIPLCREGREVIWTCKWGVILEL